MSVDCCAEPVAGPAVDARVLRHAWTALGPLVRGNWPVPYSLEPGRREETLAVLDEVLAGLYLVVDADGRLRWLGKAHRDGGVGARLRNHLGHQERARIFARVFVMAADPFSPPRAIEAAEGRAADLLGLRGRMGTRRWPTVTEAQWLALVTSRAAGRPFPAGGGSAGERSAVPS
ncbi:hypothetical protein OHB56_40885 [Streptomyces sp. NBC_01635]|uniref:hypothetical protein n=1 Tax=Streptomyces sp. NBC_01635 TaxID=2975904 RepID=UPI0038688B15|nr:hypothetical protein OHB56_00030 [Streptomyces sp. NBC_01635]WTD79582.1 hypothetical protein OHB56_40885 [Streptomyces sp. NBC_01635]